MGLPEVIPMSEVIPAQRLPDVIPMSEVARSPGFVDQLNSFVTGAGQIGKGYTFGFGDEASAAIGAVGNKLLDKTIGTDLTTGMTVGQAYDSYLSQIRGEDKLFQSEHPIASVGLQAVGGIANPINKVIKAPATLGQFIKQGALFGGAYGAGEGEGGIGERAKSAGISAGIGAGTGGAIAGIGAGAKALLNSDLALRARDYLSRTLFSKELGEAGRVGGAQAAPPAVTPTQAQLLKRVREIAPDKLVAAERELQQAVTEDVPLTLVEALGNAGTTRQARAVANQEPTMGMVTDFMEARQSAAPSRIEAALSKTVGGSTSPRQGGEALRKGATEIGDEFRQDTNKLAKQAFAEADAAVPEHTSPDVIRLLQHEDVAPSVERAKRAVALDRGVPTQDVPGNDAEVVRRTLADLTKRASDKFDQHNLESGYAQQLKRALENAAEAENPALKTARDAYAIMREMRRDAGEDAITLLKNIDEGRLEGAGKVLMSMDDKQISTLRSTFEKKGKLKEFKAGVRAYFQNVLDSNTGEFSGNTDVVRKMIGDKRLVKRVEAALGEKDAAELMRNLKREQDMYRGMQALNPQSGTAGNLAEEALLAQNASWIGRALRSPKQALTGALEKALLRGADEQLLQEMAQMYITNPQRGLADLRAIVPLQAGRYPYIDQTNKLVGALTRSAARGVGTQAGTLSNALRGK